MITGKRVMLDRRHHLLLVLRKGQVGNSGDTDDGGHDSGSEELQRFASLHGYSFLPTLVDCLGADFWLGGRRPGQSALSVLARLGAIRGPRNAIHYLKYHHI
jgi:hypothetical protein